MEKLNTVLISAIINVTGLYAGAITIAFIAATVRLFYSVKDFNGIGKYFFTFLRYFFMSLGITLLMVHIGLIRGWSADETIIISGASAFLSLEIITIFVDIGPKIFLKWLENKHPFIFKKMFEDISND